MATMKVSLPDPLHDWVEAQVEAGLYANNSDYVRDLIRKDQVRAEKVAAMQRAITEGLASGPAAPFDKEAFKRRMQGQFIDHKLV